MDTSNSKPSDTILTPNCNVAKKRYLLGKLFLVVTPVDATSPEEAVALYNARSESDPSPLSDWPDIGETKKYMEPFLIEAGNPKHRAHLDAYTSLGFKLTRLDADGDVSRIIIPDGTKNNPCNRPFGQ